MKDIVEAAKDCLRGHVDEKRGERIQDVVLSKMKMQASGTLILLLELTQDNHKVRQKGGLCFHSKVHHLP